MSRKLGTWVVLTVGLLCLAGLGAWRTVHSTTGTIPAPASPDETLEGRFATRVRPFLERNCFACHGPKKPRADLDLSRYAAVTSIADDPREWDLVLKRLQAEEMPPDDAPRQPSADERAAVVAWIRDLRDRETRRNAGDPGTVLARRLSNAEFDYTIRDLTGVDIRPTHEFPVDPADEAGFDNSGESLAMSPALLKKYLAAARLVADHAVLTPDGLAFAPHPAVTDTDRDRYCVQRIIDFYERHKVDLADYFQAAWKRRRGRPDADLGRIAADSGLSPKYLSVVWSALTDDGPEAGPLAVSAQDVARAAGGRGRGAHRLRANARPGRAPAAAAQTQGGQAARRGDIRRQPAVRAVGRPPAGEPALQLFGRCCR